MLFAQLRKLADVFYIFSYMEELLTAVKKQRLTISETVKGHPSFAVTSTSV
jgi:hypothetical protein